jgi:zinc transporter ZupT
MSTFWLSLLLGLGAGLADYLGGVLLVRRSPSAKALRYFVALGSGFMLSAVVLEFVSAKTSYSVLLGLATHTFFDGIAIGSGFALSNWLGWVLFFAIFLHKIPEGFTVASVMLAGGRSKTAALNSALFLGATTVAGVLVISLQPSLVKAGLPLSAGVTFYVAATDLVPEVNREPGIRMALVFFVGVLIFVLLRQFVPA